MAITPLKRTQLKAIFEDKELRLEVAKQSFFHFMTIYLSHRFELKPAFFHKDMINALDSLDAVNKYIAILGFRGSAKSTILENFALWSALNGMHNFIVWIGNTDTDAKLAMANIRNEIEENEELRKDFDIILKDEKGHDFREKWSEAQITIGDCTILTRSRGQKVRGMKFKKARIDMIIGDDLEDTKDADTAEKRKKTRQWFFTEVLPATKKGVQADKVKVVLLGNLVHRDCLIRNLSKGKIVKVLEFGLFDKNGRVTWPALYPTQAHIDAQKEEVMLAGEGMGHVIWAREYLLKDADSEDMIITLEDIKRYPKEWLLRKPDAAGVGVDFAISKKQTADYTAAVKGMDVRNDEGERRLLIMPGVIEKRMNFEETITELVTLNSVMPHGTKFYPEKVAYQQAAIEIMEKNGLTCVPMPSVTDKRSRAIAAMFYVKNGRVLFPEEGAERLIENILGFGIEDHDDLTDACVNLILGMVKRSGGIILG